MNGFIQIITPFVGVLVFFATVLSIWANLQKADRADVKSLQLQLDAVRRDLLTQQSINHRLQLQLDEKNKQIAALQDANTIEEEILENRDPTLENALATLVAGQSKILELLTAGKQA